MIGFGWAAAQETIISLSNANYLSPDTLSLIQGFFYALIGVSAFGTVILFFITWKLYGEFQWWAARPLPSPRAPSTDLGTIVGPSTNTYRGLISSCGGYT
jgi:hypothetical protein